MITAIIFLLILSILVLIHELGHFLVAKKLGIRVEEFGFGFPPKAFSFKKGETEYSINWLPIGGFVKLYGEDEAGGGRVQLKVQNEKLKVEDKKRAFYARSVKQRSAVVIAGVVMNAVLAAVIFYAFLGISNFKTEIPLIDSFHFFGVTQTNKTDLIISAVSKNSPAEKIGITQLSKVITINGEKMGNIKQFVEVINTYKGKEVEIVWQNTKTTEIKKAIVTPRVNPPKNEGALGIAFFGTTTAVLEYKTPVEKIFSGMVHPVNMMVYNFDIMGKLIGVSIKQKTVEPISQGVAGPVGIYSLVGTIVKIPDMKERILNVLNLSGLLSISLAFFNILPIPALDGGRLFFIIIEAVTGRKINQRLEGYIHTIGMIILLSLIFLITFKDIGNLLRP